ncbi:hypothetical protein DIURU_004654 [Diutina rugosa]|uniref:ATP-dependent RNA helicase n=1 Tax=Diutina rugosa TaxID=5481 RepID=A0A642UGL9_DIURU|nr:uncharacterized protein DIURU_004654 [Diutina rugosa]KAA8898534.1 hypothetical protein DIURU_004654 [Diutina rugosa]
MFGGRYDPSASTPAAKTNILDRFRKRQREPESDSESEDNNDNNEENNDDKEDSSSSDDDAMDVDEDEVEVKAKDPIEETKDASSSEATSSSSSESSESESSESESDSDSEATTHTDSIDIPLKHQHILNKFHQAAAQSTQEADEIEEDEPEPEVELAPLEPMPQPALPRDKKLHTVKLQANLDWLTQAHYVDPSRTVAFEDLGVSENTTKNLAKMGFTEAFSVQVAVLEHFASLKSVVPRPDVKGDLLVNAATGSGKTLAYTVPIVESLQSRVVPRVRAVVIVPTKPLINQVVSTFTAVAKGTSLSVLALKTERSLKEEATKITTNCPDIIVSTPGRLVEHLQSKVLDLSTVQYLVIDEADRLLNQSFQNWAHVVTESVTTTSNVARSFTHIPVVKMVFSATLTSDAGKLAVLNFQKPHLLVVNDAQELVNEMFSVPATLTEQWLHLGSAKSAFKPWVLAKYLIATNATQNTLVFCKSNDASLRLAKLLAMVLATMGSTTAVGYINSTNNKAQQRKQVLDGFSAGTTGILVTTDLFARGIDILSIRTVVNYDLPNSSREYVHRVGRTARAGQAGTALSMTFGKGEQKWFKSLMSDISRKQPVADDVEVPSMTSEDTNVYEATVEQFKRLVRGQEKD